MLRAAKENCRGRRVNNLEPGLSGRIRDDAQESVLMKQRPQWQFLLGRRWRWGSRWSKVSSQSSGLIGLEAKGSLVRDGP